MPSFAGFGGQVRRWLWWLLLVTAFLFPWVAVVGAFNAMALWFPGKYWIDHWRDLSSICFLLGGMSAATLLLQLPKPLVVRLMGGLLVVAGSLLLALAVQLRSTCGDEPVYLGDPAAATVASCG